MDIISDEFREALRWFERHPGALALLAGEDYRCVYANAACTRYAGQRPLLGSAIFRLFPELEEQGLRTLFDKVSARQRPYVRRSQKIRLGNRGMLEWHSFDVILQPVSSLSGQRLGLVVQCCDADRPGPRRPGKTSRAAASGQARPAPAACRSVRAPAILLVDADLARRCALGALAAPLLEQGGRILYAANATDAIRLFTEAPDLVVSAEGLPDLPSQALLRIARHACPAAARLLLADGAPALQAGLAGADSADAVFAWPEQHAGLLERMRGILRRGGA